MEKILDFNKVDFSFGENKILNKMDLAIKKGEILALCGRSGIGKSTIVNLILGRLKPKFGKIEKSFKGLRICFQDARLIPWLNIENNIQFNLKKTNLDLFDKVIKNLHLEELLTLFPEQLSGGQKHRVAIARAIVSEVEFIVFDESFSALDSALKLEVLLFLKEIKIELNQTYLMISHSAQEVEDFSTRKLLLD